MQEQILVMKERGECLICKKEFYEYLCRNKKYCSRECKSSDPIYIELMKKNRQDRPKSSYKPHSEETKKLLRSKLKGLKPWNTGKKLTEEHKEKISKTHITTESSYYRKKAYSAYGKLCNRCNSDKFICVHHKDENRKNNDITNLEVLCKRCHQLHHKK